MCEKFTSYVSVYSTYKCSKYIKAKFGDKKDNCSNDLQTNIKTDTIHASKKLLHLQFCIKSGSCYIFGGPWDRDIDPYEKSLFVRKVMPELKTNQRNARQSLPAV